MIFVVLAAAARLAVLDVHTGAGVDPALGAYLTQVVASEVAARTGSAPLVSADVTAMLGFEKKKQMLGCSEEDSGCLAEITSALGVTRVVVTSVAASGGRYLVAMSLLDSQHAKPLARAAESSPRDDDELVKALRFSAWRLFGGALPAEPSRPWTRRNSAVVLSAGALALLAGGLLAGGTALSAARRGDAGTARPRAHIADALFVGAGLCAGASVYLWTSGRPAVAASLRMRW